MCSLNSESLFWFQLDSFSNASEALSKGYVAQTAFDEFVRENDLAWCRNWL